MKIEIGDRKKNALLKRDELTVSIDHSGKATPNRKEIMDGIAKEIKAKAENIIVTKITTHGGTSVSTASVYAYSRKEDIPEWKLKKFAARLGKIKGQAKPPEETKPEAPAAEPSEEAKPAEAAAEEAKPEETKPAEQPSGEATPEKESSEEKKPEEAKPSREDKECVEWQRNPRKRREGKRRRGQARSTSPSSPAIITRYPEIPSPGRGSTAPGAVRGPGSATTRAGYTAASAATPNPKGNQRTSPVRLLVSQQHRISHFLSFA
jgi:ribosomal protein S24E